MSLHSAHLTSLACRLGRANKPAPVITAVCVPRLRQPASTKFLPVAAASLPTQRDRLPRVFGPAPARSVACRSAEQQLELSEESVEEALQVTDQSLGANNDCSSPGSADIHRESYVLTGCETGAHAAVR